MNSEGDRPVGNRARETGKSGRPRDRFQQVDGSVRNPQFQGVVARLQMVGEVHAEGAVG